jgi:hypothetical protein
MSNIFHTSIFVKQPPAGWTVSGFSAKGKEDH